MMKRRTNVLLDIGSHVVLVISTIIAIFPLVWILLSSVKGKGELTQFPTRFGPNSLLQIILRMLLMIYIL